MFIECWIMWTYSSLWRTKHDTMIKNLAMKIKLLLRKRNEALCHKRTWQWWIYKLLFQSIYKFLVALFGIKAFLFYSKEFPNLCLDSPSIQKNVSIKSQDALEKNSIPKHLFLSHDDAMCNSTKGNTGRIGKADSWCHPQQASCPVNSTTLTTPFSDSGCFRLQKSPWKALDQKNFSCWEKDDNGKMFFMHTDFPEYDDIPEIIYLLPMTAMSCNLMVSRLK